MNLIIERANFKLNVM